MHIITISSNDTKYIRNITVPKNLKAIVHTKIISPVPN